jgi:hypothetical protein
MGINHNPASASPILIRQEGKDRHWRAENIKVDVGPILRPAVPLWRAFVADDDNFTVRSWLYTSYQLRCYLA